jgi:hypothetical protein
MFEGIKHIFSSDGMTGASYTAGDVMGSISFISEPHRTAIRSSIGPEVAVRECTWSHYYSDILRRHKARAHEEVSNYA